MLPGRRPSIRLTASQRRVLGLFADVIPFVCAATLDRAADEHCPAAESTSPGPAHEQSGEATCNKEVVSA